MALQVSSDIPVILSASRARDGSPTVPFQITFRYI